MFFAHFFRTKLFFFCQNVTRKKLQKQCSYKKRAQKMLMKLTIGVAFQQNFEDFLTLLKHSDNTVFCKKYHNNVLLHFVLCISSSEQDK